MTPDNDEKSTEDLVSNENYDMTEEIEQRLSLSTHSSSSISTAEPHLSDDLQTPEKRHELTRQVSPAIGAGAAPELGKILTGRSAATNMTNDPAFEVDYEEDGQDDPRQWKMWYKAMIIGFVSWSTMIV
jgi:hypothetical protein